MCNIGGKPVYIQRAEDRRATAWYDYIPVFRSRNVGESDRTDRAEAVSSRQAFTTPALLYSSHFSVQPDAEPVLKTSESVGSDRKVNHR